MAADAWLVYASAKEWIGDGTIDLDDDTFKVDLVTSSYTPNLNSHTAKTDLGANILSGNGYATFTATITWTKSGGTITFDSDNPQYSASGGDLVARYAAYWDDTVTTPTADPLICYSLLDNSPANITITDGNTGTVTISASGVFQTS